MAEGETLRAAHQLSAAADFSSQLVEQAVESKESTVEIDGLYGSAGATYPDGEGVRPFFRWRGVRDDISFREYVFPHSHWYWFCFDFPAAWLRGLFVFGARQGLIRAWVPLAYDR